MSHDSQNYLNLIIKSALSLSYLLGIFKRITKYLYDKLEYFYYKHIVKKPHKIKIETVEPFDEKMSNESINNLNFYFITSNQCLNKNYTNLGLFHATAIVEKDKRLIHTEQDKIELVTMNNLKEAKDKSLIKLANIIKSAGGNGVVDLKIEYGLIGLGGDHYQITAMGMGIYI